MEDVRFIINKNNTQHLSESGGKFDQDKTVLVFEYYIRYLYSQGCTDICIVCSEHDRDRINIEKLSLGTRKIIKDSVFTHKSYKKQHKEILTDIVKRSRLCLGFNYNGSFEMLETDTLIGTGWFNKLSGETLYPGKDVTHSIGNLGLVPYRSGNKGTKKDYPQYKFSACDEETIKELNSIMFYGDSNSGIYSINDNSTKEDVCKVIYERESYIIEQIPELKKLFES